MATCGSFSMWCMIFGLALLASLGMSQRTSQTSGPSGPDSCTGYNGTCTNPNLPERTYCLTNGTTMHGFCAAQEAICQNHATLDTDDAACTSSSTLKVSSVSTSRTTIGPHRRFEFTTDESSINTGKDTAAAGLQAVRHIIMMCGVLTLAYASRLLMLF